LKLFFILDVLMKQRALILFFPLLVFLIETASFSSTMKNSCGKMSCLKQQQGMSCHHKKQNDQKSSEKCNTDCSFCPICSTFTFQSQYEWPSKNLLLLQCHASTDSKYVSSYIPSVWKPPNTYFI